MRRIALLASTFLIAGAAACSEPATDLTSARAGHKPIVAAEVRQSDPPPKPPAKLMSVVHYPSAVGAISGYLTPIPEDGQRHPAIVWVSGGDLAIGDFWSPKPRENDQSAAAFRERGVVTFYPSLRGLNGNPGHSEAFYGEVDDLVAATRWLKQQPGIDPARVYLGGHSTGGTLVLLASEYSDEWAGVFSFGPVIDPRLYGDMFPIETKDKPGIKLRAPIHWLASVRKPTLVIEGSERGNIVDLNEMKAVSSNPQLHFVAGAGCDHFTILRPASEIIADAIHAGVVDALWTGEKFTNVCG